VKEIRNLPGGVFEGGRLHEAVPPYPVKGPVLCRLAGHGGQVLNLDADIFSKHLCFMGGIGTGKTNAIFHVVKQLRQARGRTM